METPQNPLASYPRGRDGRVIRCGRVRDGCIWAGAWHLPTLSWVPPDTSPALQAAGCASCASVHTLYASGRTTDIVTDSDGVSHIGLSQL